MQRILLTAMLGFVLSICGLQAQSLTADQRGPAASHTNLPELHAEDWSVFVDADNQVYYIDFENFTMTISEVIVRNAQGETVLQDQVFDLPVNTIYEIDFSELPRGRYEIELRAITGLLRKEIYLK